MDLLKERRSFWFTVGSSLKKFEIMTAFSECEAKTKEDIELKIRQIKTLVFNSNLDEIVLIEKIEEYRKDLFQMVKSLNLFSQIDELDKALEDFDQALEEFERGIPDGASD
jgi:hypothetical protein